MKLRMKSLERLYNTPELRTNGVNAEYKNGIVFRYKECISAFRLINQIHLIQPSGIYNTVTTTGCSLYEYDFKLNCVEHENNTDNLLHNWSSCFIFTEEILND